MNATTIANTFSDDDSREHAVEYLRREGVLEAISRGEADENRIPADYRDLARLHWTVRMRKVFTILEFGVGFSTVVMADALLKNRQEWEALEERPTIRKAAPHELHAVDTSLDWIERAKAMVPEPMKSIVTLHHSDVLVGTFLDRACHFYDQIPDIVPDLIYLDGPDPADVIGDIGGLSWSCSDRVVMSGDILRMEPQLLPGTIVVIDGRTGNGRFICCHLYRDWNVCTNWDGDVTVLELDEEPLGPFNMRELVYRNGIHR